MRKLEEIFKGSEELRLANNILGSIRDSIFEKKDVGVPSFTIETVGGIGDRRNITARLVEEGYLAFHPNSYYSASDNKRVKSWPKDNVRLCLTETYKKQFAHNNK